MLMQIRFRDAIERGTVTLTFRRWKRPQVVAGNTYRTAAGRIVVDAVDVVDPDRITTADAKRAGFASRAELLGELRGAPDLPTYRVRFHPAPTARSARGCSPTTAALSADEVDDIGRRLARLDRASSHGSWTHGGAARRSRRGRPCAPPTSPRASVARPSRSSSTSAS